MLLILQCCLFDVCMSYYFTLLITNPSSFLVLFCLHYYYSNLVVQWLADISDKISSLGAFGGEILPNHVLVNEYTPGQGIMVYNCCCIML